MYTIASIRVARLAIITDHIIVFTDAVDAPVIRAQITVIAIIVSRTFRRNTVSGLRVAHFVTRTLNSIVCTGTFRTRIISAWITVIAIVVSRTPLNTLSGFLTDLAFGAFNRSTIDADSPWPFGPTGFLAVACLAVITSVHSAWTTNDERQNQCKCTSN
jgi:hypothetical protein